MRSNVEIRELAWKRLWTDKWFGRLFGGGLLLGVCGYAVQAVVGVVLRQLNVWSWRDYVEALAQNRQDLTTPIPNLTPEFISQATSSTILIVFFSWLMAGIAAYGGAVILRRCLDNDEPGWLGASFGGYKMPFEMLWMFVRLVLTYAVWLLLGVVVLGVTAGACRPQLQTLLSSGSPASLALLSLATMAGLTLLLLLLCVPFYRYRFLFLVKAEHPDWGAGRCFASCRQMMKGNMMKSFRLDCAYWKSLTVLLLLGVALMVGVSLSVLLRSQSGALAALAALVCFLLLMAMSVATLVVSLHIRVGQGFFYQDIKGALGEAK